jgi:hypothetical protein
LDPDVCGGHSWREQSRALGFLQFFLQRPLGNGLAPLQTNTVSSARMGAHDGLYAGADGVVWNLRQVNRYSSALNRMIKKMAVAKIASQPVLPGAALHWEEGGSFGPHWSKRQSPDLYQAN